MSREFLLPDLGEGIAEAQIVRLLIKQGERIAEDQYLMEVETDKAAVEIPSPFAGIAETLHVQEGQIVNVGDVIVTFDGNGDGDAAPAANAETQAMAAASAPSGGAARSSVASPPAVRPSIPSPTASAARKPATVAQPEHARPSPTLAKKANAPVAAAPAVRRLAREMGLDLTLVSGTGPGGRITRDDLQHHATGAAAPPAGTVTAAAVSAPLTADSLPTLATPMPLLRGPSPLTDLPAGTDETDGYGEVRRVGISQIRKTIARRMAQSAYTAVHVTHGDEADITQLEALRKDLNHATDNDPKLTVMTLVIRAICIALRHHPVFNASFDETGSAIIYKKYVHLGIAVDSERGLIVPVIRDCDQLTMRGIAFRLREIADRIRSNQFGVEDLRGGTFTITNVGALGGTFNTPIINYPEVAILGLGRAKKVPVIRKGNLEESLILPLNLSFDHRATDGANAARFTSMIKSYLETPARFLLD